MHDGVIAAVDARGVYDSNGAATIEVSLRTRGGMTARAFAQRGSSTGQFEARHLENGAAQPDLAAVNPALASVSELVRPALLGADVSDMRAVDDRLAGLDPTPTLERVGGNVVVATSMAAAELGALVTGRPVFRHLAPDQASPRLPQPAFNIIDGATSPGSKVAHHEFLLFPVAGTATAEAVAMAVRVRQAVRSALHARGADAGDSPQGALAVDLPDVPTGLGLVVDAAVECGYQPERDFFVGLDMAAADVFDGERYRFGWASHGLVVDGLLEAYVDWFGRFPLRYVEDAFGEQRGADFAELRRRAPSGAIVAGDDLFASNPSRVIEGLAGSWADAVVLKPNQVGTTSALLAAAGQAADGGMEVLLSQRSGENDSALIVHLGVAAGAAYIKTGGPSRMDRVTKLNELLRLDDQLRSEGMAA